MISIIKNPNFGNWFQVFAFGKFIEEFNKQSKAVRFAKNLAKDAQLTHINIEGKSHGLL